MKITSVRVHVYTSTYTHGAYTMSGGRVGSGHPCLVVCLRTDEGVEGWGEAGPHGATYLPAFFEGELAALELLANAIIGLDPCNLGKIHAVMDETMLAGFSAKSAIDAACLDIAGKFADLPVTSLLGGVVTDAAPAFLAVPVGSPEEMATYAEKEIANGVQRLQVKVGDEPAVDVKRLRSVFEAADGRARVWADANAGWRVPDALQFAAGLEGLRITLEQPCRSMADCAQVGALTGFPIVLDESIFTMEDLMRGKQQYGAVGVNIKLARVGGLSKARVLRDAAVSLDMSVTCDDAWGGTLVTAQNVVLATTTSTSHLVGVSLFSEWTAPHIGQGPRMNADGTVSAPTSPGLGVAVDVKALGEPVFERAT